MPEGTTQRSPEAQSEEIPQITADDLDQNLETYAEGQALPDLQLVEEENEAPTEFSKPEKESIEKNEKKQAELEEIRRRQILKSGIEPIYNLAESDEFTDEEIVAHLGPWIEKYGAKPENISEILKYFELAEKIISPDFPADRRTEVICAFAEVIAEGHLDAESLATLISEIVPAEEAADGQAEQDGYNGVAFFQEADRARGTRIVLLEKFFQQNEDGTRAYNIAHMIKHEIGHGLVRYGELLTQDEIAAVVRKTRNPEQQENQEVPKISAEIRKILDQARTDQNFQTYHLTTVLRSLHELRSRQGVTKAQIQQREIMAANQIMAEKIGIFLSSNGEFGDFLRANIEVTSNDNLFNIFGTTEQAEIKEIITKITQTSGNEQAAQLTKLRHECPGLSRFLESNKVFFDLASERLQDKDQLKERIEKNMQNKTDLDDIDDDFFGYYEDGFYEPVTPVSSGTEKSKEQRSNWVSLTLELANAFGKEVESTTPITELTKDH